MTTTSAAEKLVGHGVEKKAEKVEKRRALGRGLASLLPGPRVVAPSPELRVPGTEPSAHFDGVRTGSFAKDTQDAAVASPQGLKPESFSPQGGTAEAVPFPSSLAAREAGAEGRGGVGKTEIPRFAPNHKSDGTAATLEPPASPELEANGTGVSDPYKPASHEQMPSAAFAAGPSLEQADAHEVISIPAVAEGGVVGNRVVHLPIDVIEKNPYQTRSVFDEETLWELRDSIKEHGVVQPVVVRPAEEEERYILVLGERRLRASRMAGKETIPALVRRLSPQQAAEMTVLENIVREDLNPIEQAEAFRVLSLEFKLTQAQIADRIGLSRETVSNYMRLLRLPRKVMDYMLSDRLSFSDAREILRLENDDAIEAVAEEVVTHKLKWDQIEDRVMRINGSFPMLPGQTLPGEKKKSGGARWMDPNVRAAQTDMERTLGMRVRIRDRHGKGKIVIEYASVDDYERVTSMLRGKE
jgi:ParB family transcriptional regulator, chromosome partitioning protein